MFRRCALSFAALVLFAPALSAMQRASCVIHLHSRYSDARHPPLADVVAKAREAGIDVVIPTDHDLQRWEYGLWPLRGLLCRRYSLGSVLRTGARAYLDEIRRLEDRYPGIIVIPGVESAPFHYWTGNILDGNLTLNDAQKHILVVGMENADDYRRIPVVSNRSAGAFDAAALWPALLLVLPLLMKRYRILPPILGILLLAVNYPFRRPPFSPYDGPQGDKPYQRLIDYARTRGALTFWAHPDAPNWEKPARVGPVSSVTRRYPESLLATTGYTGFAIYSEGNRQAGAPGGIWDRTLAEYCRGQRERPPWAIGELDYGTGSFAVNEIQNILWVEEKKRGPVIASIARGNLAVLRRTKEWWLALDEFAVSSGSATAVCGQEIAARGPVRVLLALRCSDGAARPARITVIRDGAPVTVISLRTPARAIYEDTEKLAPGRHFYRVTVDAGYPHGLAANPVFVTR